MVQDDSDSNFVMSMVIACVGAPIFDLWYLNSSYSNHKSRHKEWLMISIQAKTQV